MRRLALTMVLTMAVAAPVSGQATFGPQLSWGDGADLGIGARVQVPVSQLTTAEAGSPLSTMFLIGSFDWFFPDDGGTGADVNYFEINANAAYPIVVEGFRPYAGGGLSIARQSVEFNGASASDTEVGLNLLGGLNFLLGTLNGFAEARFELGGGEQFVLSAGVLFGGS